MGVMERMVHAGSLKEGRRFEEVRGPGEPHCEAQSQLCFCFTFSPWDCSFAK